MGFMLKEVLGFRKVEGEDMKVTTVNLKNYCSEVAEGESVLKLVASMLLACEKNQGMGLAANQLGVMQRIIVVNYSGFTQALINPVIIKQWGGMSVMQEGCLSFPTREATVFRHRNITIVGFDVLWKPVKYKWRGVLARCAQHEMDHLDGITMFDRQVKAMNRISNG